MKIQWSPCYCYVYSRDTTFCHITLFLTSKTAECLMEIISNVIEGYLLEPISLFSYNQLKLSKNGCVIIFVEASTL